MLKYRPTNELNFDEFSDVRVENAILGACMLFDDEAVGKMIETGIKADYFTQPHASKLFTILVDLYTHGKKIDILVVCNVIREMKYDQAFLAYSMRTTQNITSSAFLTIHCEILHELYVKRETIELGKRLLLSTTSFEHEELLAQLQQLGNERTTKKYDDDIQPITNCIALSENEMEKRVELAKRGEMSGITTGITDLNALTNGWQPATLNIIAGRPSMGKTAIALHFALAAARIGKHVCIYSMEMTRVQLTDRMILALAPDLNADHYRNGNMTNYDYDAFHYGKSRLCELPIHINDTAVCTTGYIMANARKMKGKQQCDIIIIDYLQLTDMSNNVSKQYNREQQVAKASRDFKILAKELDVPVLLLSQLSRSVESRAIKKPQLADLRESGSIEQDADLVGFIYRPEYYGEEGHVFTDTHGNFVYGTAYFIVAKQRQGPLGEVLFCYDRSLTRIWDSDGRTFPPR